MATFKPTIFKTKNHIKADGTTNVKIRVYHKKESQYMATPYYINPDHFFNGYITPHCHNYTTLNYEIGEIIQGYLKTYINLGSTRASKMSCKDLKDLFVKEAEIASEYIDFIAFSRKVISETARPNTAEWYEYAVQALCWHFGKQKISALEITANNLNDMMKKMSIAGMNGKPLEAGGISAYLRAIRALFNKCRAYYNDEDFNIIKIPHDPFKRIKIPKPQRKKKNVPIEVIKKIRDFDGGLSRDILARDMFMIMFYLMGINVNDLYNLQSPRFGRIHYERAKTDTDNNADRYPLSIRIEPELIPLLKMYSEDGFLSGIKKRYSNSANFTKAVNKGLANICKELRIPKVTTNWARHSWASIARNKAGMAKADVDFCLGHVNRDYKMADIYIEIDYGIYDKVNRATLDLLI